MSGTDVGKRATVACPFCGTLNRVDWCGPCKIMAPILDALLGSSAGQP